MVTIVLCVISSYLVEPVSRLTNYAVLCAFSFEYSHDRLVNGVSYELAIGVIVVHGTPLCSSNILQP